MHYRKVRTCLNCVIALVAAVNLIAFPAAAQSATAPSKIALSSTPEFTQADLEAWLDGFVPYALQKNDIAGMVVLVVKDGKVLLQKGYGYADLAKRTPMDPQRTLMCVASVSKLFTWTAVMQLVEQGKLDLDRDVNDYLDFKIPPAFGKPITMRNLMTHTGGFEERLKGYVPSGATAYSLGDYLRTVPAPTRIYSPGTVPAYSNYGANLAGYIVERVSGEPFVDYVDRHILIPLGMNHSTFRTPLPERLQGDLAKNYGLASSGEPLSPSANKDEIIGEPAGDLMSTANDMSRFMLAHLQQGRYGDYQLLRPDTAKWMYTPALRPVPNNPGTALGFFRSDYNGHRIISHDGDLSGFHTDMQLLLDDGVGFFTSVNSDGVGSFLPAGSYLRVALFHQFMDRYFPPPPFPEEPTLATAKQHARQVAGEYEMSRRPSGTFWRALFLAGRVAIKANNDGTIETPAWLNFSGIGPQKWREVGPFIWREVGERERLDMKVENGRVRAWLPEDVPSAFVFEPVPFWRSAALNLPLFISAVIVLLLTALMWPVAAVVRRRHDRKLEIQGREGKVYRLARFAVLVGVLFLLGWAVLIVGVAGGPAGFNVGMDPWIRLLQLIGLVCVAGAAVAVWNAWLTCAGSRSLWAKAWSVVLAFAMLDLVWFSFAFNLISTSLNY